LLHLASQVKSKKKTKQLGKQRKNSTNDFGKRKLSEVDNDGGKKAKVTISEEKRTAILHQLRKCSDTDTPKSTKSSSECLRKKLIIVIIDCILLLGRAYS
jgi:hypothetical protein